MYLAREAFADVNYEIESLNTEIDRLRLNERRMLQTIEEMQ